MKTTMTSSLRVVVLGAEKTGKSGESCSHLFEIFNMLMSCEPFSFLNLTTFIAFKPSSGEQNLI